MNEKRSFIWGISLKPYIYKIALSIVFIIIAVVARANASDINPRQYKPDTKIPTELIGVEIPALMLFMPSDTSDDLPFGYGGIIGFAMYKWKYFYWNILEFGIGVNYKNYIQFVHLGTEVGFPIYIGNRKEHQINVGLGIGFGSVGTDISNECDGACYKGGGLLVFSPNIRYTYHTRGGFFFGTSIRFMIPTSEANLFGSNIKYGILLLTSFVCGIEII